ncbi:hypothetical protein T492DRAFT_1119818, partial [Pavlovales sp. CCMP2436]
DSRRFQSRSRAQRAPPLVSLALSLAKSPLRQTFARLRLLVDDVWRSKVAQRWAIDATKQSDRSQLLHKRYCWALEGGPRPVREEPRNVNVVAPGRDPFADGAQGPSPRPTCPEPPSRPLGSSPCVASPLPLPLPRSLPSPATMAEQLTPGCVLAMRNNTSERGQIVQVIYLRLLQAPPNGGKELYRIVISDGTCFQLFGSVSTQLHEVVAGMYVNAIICLDSWSLKEVGGRSIIIVLGFTILNPNRGERIDRPVSIREFAGDGGNGGGQLNPQQEPAETLQLYMQAAEQGDAHAQNNAGRCYMTGNGTAHDEVKAARLFRKAAKQGLADAQFALASCFADGRGVVQDAEEAVKLYRLAVEQGSAGAQHALGRYYAEGKRGLVQDEEKMARLYKQAAEQGLAAAQHDCGIIYHSGTGVAQDHETAVRFYRQAAEQRLAGAQHALGECYATGIGGLVQDDEEAARLYKQAAEQGLAAAQYDCGIIYHSGTGVAQDHETAVRFYRRAAE